jgi:Kef-type K+ transport system membrane component KefB
MPGIGLDKSASVTDDHIHALLMTLIGAATVLAALASTLFKRLGLPALVAYMLMGFGLRVADGYWPVLLEPVEWSLALLADLGLVALLFHTGLNSNLQSLLAKLPTASPIWISDIVLSALLGYVASRYGLGLELIPSLAIATALTATSVGVSVNPWQEADKLNSEPGKLLIDVAELDDISGIALMVVLFAILPVLQGGSGNLWLAAGGAAGFFFVKFLLFIVFCYVFAHFVEPYVSALYRRLAPPLERIISVIGLGFLIAALAGWLGFSLAIGALFAGLAFSRDPEAVKADKAFRSLYIFFIPFFFIGIGLSIDPQALGSGLQLGGLLLIAAILGKLLGAGLATRVFMDNHSALLIGLSMVPRAEIAMVIMDQAHRQGAVNETIYAAMVVVSAGTCLLAPVLLRPLLGHWSQQLADQR